MVSSSMWITYSQMVPDTPLLVRGSSDLVLFTISATYISYNRYIENKPALKKVEESDIQL